MINELKQWRKARALTQEQAAEQISISVRHWQRLEAGHRPVTPMVEKLLKLT